ncbi:MAG: hypothetical protein QG566_600 [Patescibacteria group bacterium]|jgi:hypothetical protein|nr:hypothetical protein [Patescibacteria group bacterium]
MDAKIQNEQIFELDDSFSRMSLKLIDSCIKKIHKINKTVNVAGLDDFTDKYIVRAGKQEGNGLYKEQEEGKVEFVGYLSVRKIENHNKKANFGVWKKILSSSEILV